MPYPLVVPNTDNRTHNVDSKETLNCQAKWVIAASIVSGVAGAVILILGGINLFGAVGSAGFIASMAGGGTLVCLAIGGTTWIVVTACKAQKQEAPPEKKPSPPEKKNLDAETDKKTKESEKEDSKKTTGAEANKTTKEAKKKEDSKKTIGADVDHRPKETEKENSKKNTDADLDKTTKETEKKEDSKEATGADADKTKEAENKQTSKTDEKTSNKPDAVNQAEEEKKYRDKQEQFRQRVKAVMDSKTAALPAAPFDCSQPDFKAAAEEAFPHFFHRLADNSPIKNFLTDSHGCLTTDKIPRILFKTKKNKSDDISEYVARAENAQKICKDHNLYLIHIPQCQLVDFKKSVMMQEHGDFLEGDWRAQKACYRWAIQDPQLQPYMKELLRQLTIFICLMNERTILSDHVVLTQDGRASLVHLDKANFTGSSLKWKNGVFDMAPLKWLDDLVDTAKQHLSAKDFESIEKQIPKLKEKALKRKENSEKRAQFYQSKNITLPTTPIRFEYKGKPEVALFIEKLEQHLNKKIASLPHLSMETGRKISIRINIGDKFFDEFVNEPLCKAQKIWCPQFNEIAKEGLAELKKLGYLYYFKLNTDHDYMTVVC